MTFDDFEIVVGLEIHVRLNTKSKAFCSDLNEYGHHPNSNISVISLAHPGTLPIINKSQIQKAIKMGLALGSKISAQTYFDRKHYFYPDLPKGYQLTQDKMPICIGGKLNIQGREIRIHHIHMEEDAGKLIHSDNSNESYVDHNRAGVPLLEIVTEPDLRSGQEVHDFMQSMIQLIEWIDISDANLEEGSFRCDCNVSIRPKGASKLGERCEIKNLNSKKFARQAVESEARRQYGVIKEGGAIKNQTMSFDPVSGKTTPTRSKESVHDYRYFQDPDLVPIQLSSDLIESLNNEIHPLPNEVIRELQNENGLTHYEAEIITRGKPIYQYFLSLTSNDADPKLAANVLINKILPFLDSKGISLSEFQVKTAQIIEFMDAISNEEISHTSAFQKLFPYLLENNSLSVQQIIDKLDLGLTTDNGALTKIIETLLEKNPDELKRYKGGKKALFGFFMGEVMKSSKGKFDPKAIKSELSKIINS